MTDTDTARLREEHIEPEGYPRRMKSRHELRAELNLAADEIDRLRAELTRCGKENCVGLKSEGVASWVREERLIECQAELAEARREKALIVEWRDLAIRAIDCVHDAELESGWGQGASVWDRLRNEQNELLHNEQGNKTNEQQ